jgi:hypothetical protein
MFYPDAATKVFASSIILVTFLYIAYYRQKCNKLVLALVALVIFVGAVNHLLLAAVLSILVAFSLKKPVRVAFGFGVFISLYLLIAPRNLAMIQARLSLIWDAVRKLHFSDLSIVGPKGEYVLNYFRDLANHPYYFGVTGVGLGQYSDRAAMYLSGKKSCCSLTFQLRRVTFFLYNSFVAQFLKELFLPILLFSLLAELIVFSFIVAACS